MEAAAPSRAAAAAAIGRAGEALLRRAAALVAAAARARVGGDAEAVHDLRVAARRLEAALGVWGAAAGPCGSRAARAARRATRRVRQAAGDARELEVHVELLEQQVLPESGSAHSTLRLLLVSLRAERERARQAVAGIVDPRQLDRVADRIAAVVVALRETPEAFTVADGRVRRARLGAADRLNGAADTLHDERLHAARIAVKKWRYAAESRAAAQAEATAAPFAELRAVQKALGSIHDHAALRDLLWKRVQRAGRQGEQARAAALASLASCLEHDRLELLMGLPQRLRALAAAVQG